MASKGFYVDKSTVPGLGLGLFTTNDYQAGETILDLCGYPGSFCHKPSEEKGMVVCIELDRGIPQTGKPVYVKPLNAWIFSRFINDATYGKPAEDPSIKPNVELVENMEWTLGRKGGLNWVVTEPVFGSKAREELFTSYGYKAFHFEARRRMYSLDQL